MTSTNRYTLIDWLRALAIVLMFIYHFSYDLMSFNFIEATTFNGLFMTAIGRSCLTLFMFCMGYSLALSHNNGIQWKKFWHRWLKLVIAASAVSLGTFLSYPDYWIYFGILHCIAITSLVVVPLLQLPRIALALGLAMMIAYVFFDVSLPFLQLNRASLDYIPIFPWMWSTLVGIGLYPFDLHKKIQPPFSKITHWLSNHSLAIYLIHQPVLMGIVYMTFHISGF